MNNEHFIFYANKMHRKDHSEKLGSLYKIFMTNQFLLGARLPDYGSDFIFHLPAVIGAALIFEIAQRNFKISFFLMIIIVFASFFLLELLFKPFIAPYVKNKRISLERKYDAMNLDEDLFLKEDKHNFCIQIERIETAILQIHSKQKAYELYIALRNKDDWNLLIHDCHDINELQEKLSGSIKVLEIWRK